MGPYQEQTSPIERRPQQCQTSVGDVLKQSLRAKARLLWVATSEFEG